ncbi:MAG: T9SS type A sorting domain-containing protein, partial [Chitinophagales bacterium]|nr:T9SS type A sorting domain-containing protein [Chitinophagales bacterium]
DYGNPSGNAYQVSNAGLNDMFLARWNKTTGEPIWITYFGGTGDERGRDVRCDRDGYIYFTGQTESGFDGLATLGAWKTSFVYSTTNRDGIVAKFDSNCNKIWATYFGGNDIDFPRSLRVPLEGAPVYVAGYTKSDSAFVTSQAFDKKNKKNNDAFWLRFNWDGSVLQYATYFGGKKSESVTEPGWYGPTMELDANNNVFISSGTNSVEGIAYGNSFKDTLQGTDQYDFFVAKFADPCPDGFEPNETIEQASSLYFRGGSSITRSAPIQEKGDKDYFTFTTTGNQSNIKVVLTNLPLDYNLFLYDNNGVQIGKSKEIGTTNEVIIINNTYIGKYSILVKGSISTVYQDGACYTLSLSASDSPFKLTDETSVSASGNATIYPNPSNNSAELNFTAKLDGNYQIDISNLDGRIISSIKQHFNVGDQSLTLPVDQLASGNYLVKISGSGANEVLKFVVSK